MLASSSGQDSAILAWTAAGPIVAAIVGVLAFWVAYFPPKGRLLYSITLSEALLSNISSIPGMKVRYRGHKLRDPHRVTVRLASRGRSDIVFFKEQSVIIDIGVKIVDILTFSFSPGAPLLDVVAAGTRLKIGPGPSHIIRKGETIIVTVLSDGPSDGLRCELPFMDVRDLEANYPDPPWIKKLGLVLFITYLLALFSTSAANSAVESLISYLLLTEFLLYATVLGLMQYRRRLDR